jgi:hypothetical protein
MALGTIHAKATQAPKKLNSKSVTVAIATPNDTTASVIACNVEGKFQKKEGEKLQLFCNQRHACSMSDRLVEGGQSMHTTICYSFNFGNTDWSAQLTQGLGQYEENKQDEHILS